MKKHPKKHPLYPKLYDLFKLAQWLYPRSYVAFDPDTGEIMAHHIDPNKCAEKLERKLKKNPCVWPAITGPKKTTHFKGFLENYLLERGLAQARTLGRLRGI